MVNFNYLRDVGILSDQVHASMKNKLYDVKAIVFYFDTMKYLFLILLFDILITQIPFIQLFKILPKYFYC